MKPLKVMAPIFLSLAMLVGLFTLEALATHLLINSGFNDPFNDIPGRVWNGQNEKIADGWQPFYLVTGTHAADEGAKRLHWMSSAQFGATFGGLDYHIEGDRAQNMWSSYEFDAGVYQQVAVTPGQDYGFDIGMVTFWRGPGYPDSDGIMIKQVGLDPTGGTDPTGSSIVWSEPDDNDKAWVYMDVAATAQATTMTVFAKVQAPENTSFNHTDLDMVYFEAAHLAPVPTTSLTISISDTLVQFSWSDSDPAPDWSLKGYEVQYRDQTEEDWVTLQPKTGTETSGDFTGQSGHAYTIRVRPWQKISESYHNDIDLPGVWQEATVTLGGVVSGQVTTNRGQGLNGITVTEGTSSISTTTTGNGIYSLVLTQSGDYSFTVGTIADWTAPPPVPISPTLGQNIALSFSLRPPDDVIHNGDFEEELTEWQVSGSLPLSVTTGRRSGDYSLRLTDTVVLSQTGFISGSYQPVLSFWYKAEGGDEADTFSVEVLGTEALTAVNTLTPALTGDWQHTWLPLDGAEVYTGPVGVRFSLSQSGPTQTTVYLDEVSLGRSWGGPNQVYLPITLK